MVIFACDYVNNVSEIKELNVPIQPLFIKTDIALTLAAFMVLKVVSKHIVALVLVGFLGCTV